MLAEKRITVNMWAIAEEIDKYFKRSSLWNK
jgi:hypothetical protein